MEIGRVLTDHTACLSLVASLGVVVLALWRRGTRYARRLQREHRLREEFTAYAELDPGLPPGGDPRDLARSVCRTIVQRSFFQKAAMIARNADGRLYVAGSAGVDDLTVAALNDWCERVGQDERGSLGGRAGAKSFPVVLGPRVSPVTGALGGSPRAIIVPIRTHIGRMSGAIALCTDLPVEAWSSRVEITMQPVEGFALKLGRSFESASLSLRLLRAEKLVGLGQLAGGVAHELNNPLTAVLGYAELIAETAGLTDAARLREQALVIHAQANRMRETIQTLLRFCHPAARLEEPVDLSALLRELTSKCAAELSSRGVQLIVQHGDGAPPVRGDRDGLREVLEHLLNNAAHAIAESRAAECLRTPPGPSETDPAAGLDVIRITLNHDHQALHLIVSDTGPGFREPSRVFDPFYTTRQPGEGTGLGLTICYGIVHEHGGEISAANLHPRGAAVIVELPIAHILAPPEPGVTVPALSVPALATPNLSPPSLPAPQLAR